MAQRKSNSLCGPSGKADRRCIQHVDPGEEMAAQAKPGQFISVYTKDGSKLLPRPISICETNKETGMLRIVYRTVGQERKEFPVTRRAIRSISWDLSATDSRWRKQQRERLPSNRRRNRNSSHAGAGEAVTL